MSRQHRRAPQGGLIDRSAPLDFSFDGRTYQGYAGDTLASALLANGVHLMGRSFKYHRPRGVFGAGGEEPNALVELRTEECQEPNLRATQVELYDGLVARSQNRWPSLAFDVGGLNNVMARFLPAGFYYKTFMWPPSQWMTYEWFIRRAAGLGSSAVSGDPDSYEKRYAHCDVLVVGGGPTGLVAALAAGRAGARVILADETRAFGGSLNSELRTIDRRPALTWVAETVAELESMPRVRLLPRATVFSYYDQNMLGITERVCDHQKTPTPFQPRQRMWQVRAREVVLATGAVERPLVFGDNDRPGVMLASAARVYANQYAVRPGTRAVVFTNNDSAYATVGALRRIGVTVQAVVDAREGAGRAGGVAGTRLDSSIEALDGHAVYATNGGRHLRSVEVGRLSGGRLRRIDCDLLCVSGGWAPTLHLFSQSQGRIAYREDIASFVPEVSRQAEWSAGAASGSFTLGACLAEGLAAGAAAAQRAGHGDGVPPSAPDCDEQPHSVPLRILWTVPQPPGRHVKRFVDLQNDVSADDVGLAAREGYVSVEHLKRYTTLGMGTDQGRTSNVNGLAILADILDREIPKVGTTTFRPPFSPVTLGTIAGREVGEHFSHVRRTPMHDWHARARAPFMTAGLWMRPQCYPRGDETILESTNREARMVRTGVGIVDVSTLGKIAVQGADAAEFLERVYVNRWKSLKVGRVRYGLMLREDGLVMDDGTTARVGETDFYMTTTTAHAAQVLAHMELYAQTVWPELDVYLTSVTDQWAAIAIAGPNSRAVLETATQTQLDNDTIPFMGCCELSLGGVSARLLRITYSGELAYEVHVPAGFGVLVWEALLEAGRPYGIAPYGTEAMNVLRIEKGHVVGAELDGRTTADDLGLGGLVRTEGDFIGKRSLRRPAFQRDDRKQLVGLRPVDGTSRIPRGAQIVQRPGQPTPVKMLGHVSSTTFSANLQMPLALALVSAGRKRHGETLYAASPLTNETVAVTVTAPVAIDPQGRRPRG